MANLANKVNDLPKLKLMAVPLPLIVFAAVLGAMFLFLAVPRIIAHNAPVDDLVIHACVDKHGGIKIVDPQGDKGSKDKGSKDNDGCKKKDLVLDWNAIGPQGEKGDQGIQGGKGEKGDQGIQGEKGDKGDTGGAGPKGDTGAKGATGSPGLSGYQRLSTHFSSYVADSTATVTCPSGKKILGGGWQNLDGINKPLRQNSPGSATSLTANAWSFRSTSGGGRITVHAICAFAP